MVARTMSTQTQRRAPWLAPFVLLVAGGGVAFAYAVSSRSGAPDEIRFPVVAGSCLLSAIVILLRSRHQDAWRSARSLGLGIAAIGVVSGALLMTDATGPEPPRLGLYDIGFLAVAVLFLVAVAIEFREHVGARGPPRDRGRRGPAERGDRHDAVPEPSARVEHGPGERRLLRGVRADHRLGCLGLRRPRARATQRRAPRDVPLRLRDLRGRLRVRGPVARRVVRDRPTRGRPADRVRRAVPRGARERDPAQGDRTRRTRRGTAGRSSRRSRSRRPAPRSPWSRSTRGAPRSERTRRRS